MHNLFNERFRVEQKRAFEMYLRTGDTAAYFDVLEREEKFSPDQPRVPAGNSDGGQWTIGGGGGSGAVSSVRANAGDDGNDVGQNDPNIQRVFAPAAPIVVEKLGEAALYLYLYWASRNTPDSTAYVEFNARAYTPSENAQDPAIDVGKLTREDVDKACPRHEIVQGISDGAADRVSEQGPFTNEAVYGTKVHTAIRDDVRVLDDPNLKAELSFKNSIDGDYGETGSTRLDVIENVGDGNVCVYDVKTGKAKLTIRRMKQIAQSVHKYYPRTKRILVIEVRPKRRRKKSW